MDVPKVPTLGGISPPPTMGSSQVPPLDGISPPPTMEVPQVPTLGGISPPPTTEVPQVPTEDPCILDTFVHQSSTREHGATLGLGSRGLISDLIMGELKTLFLANS